jgi:opacity protein-like surface antigen
MNVRSLLAVAALLASPAAVHAEAKKASTQATPSSPSYAIGGWVGYEMGDLDGIVLRLDGEMPYRKLSPEVALSFVGSLGYSHLTDEAFGIDVSANILKIVPAARFSFPVNPQLTLFGDAGLGLYWASVSTEINFGTGPVSDSDSSLGFMLRFGAGGLFHVNPRTKVGAMLQLDPMFGDYDDATFSILAGVTYQL